MVMIVFQAEDGEEVRRAHSMSAGVQFPAADVQVAMGDGFESTTVGEVMSRRDPSIQKADPHSSLTRGAFPREKLLVGERGVRLELVIETTTSVPPHLLSHPSSALALLCML